MMQRCIQYMLCIIGLSGNNLWAMDGDINQQLLPNQGNSSLSSRRKLSVCPAIRRCSIDSAHDTASPKSPRTLAQAVALRSGLLSPVSNNATPVSPIVTSPFSIVSECTPLGSPTPHFSEHVCVYPAVKDEINADAMVVQKTATLFLAKYFSGRYEFDPEDGPNPNLGKIVWMVDRIHKITTITNITINHGDKVICKEFADKLIQYVTQEAQKNSHNVIRADQQ